MKDGVFNVYASEAGIFVTLVFYFHKWNESNTISEQKKENILHKAPKNLTEYYNDLNYVLRITSHGPCKSYCFRRLNWLSSKFTMHVALNTERELAIQKAFIIIIILLLLSSHSYLIADGSS